MDPIVPSYTPPPTGKALRQKLLGAKAVFKQTRLEIEIEGEKLTVIVREPSMSDRSAMFKAAGVKPKAGGQSEIGDASLLQVWAVIICTYNEAGERVFNKDDADALLQYPDGGFVSKIGSAVSNFMAGAAEAGEA
jgi:hypothetical protein